MRTSRTLLISLLLLVGGALLAQDRDPGTTSYREKQSDGSTKVIWEVTPLESETSVPEAWSDLETDWQELSNSPLRDVDTVSRLTDRYNEYLKDKNDWLRAPTRSEILRWYGDLAALNGRTTAIVEDIKKYNDANDAYKRDKEDYESTTVTQQNKAQMDAWYQRLVAEHQRLVDWYARIGTDQDNLKPAAQSLDDSSKRINSALDTEAEDLNNAYRPLRDAVSNELEIVRTTSKLEDVREKVKKNNDKLRDLSKVDATVQEAEDWANMAEDQRKKGQWDALTALASVAVTQVSAKYTAAEQVTRDELRAVKMQLMYKYKLPPDTVKKILKNWVDDGKSVLTIKTKRELFQQLGTLTTLAQAEDDATKSQYLQALGGCLGVFVKTPALSLLVTNVQIYMSLFDTGFTYYHSKERVKQLLDLSEENLKAVQSLADLNKKIVDEELIPLKKQLDDLVAKRNY
ncbi:MAG TPA: hypothetical protein VNI20_05740 [Fimbriimonadaceae bacterium]|nr:hypothetical protein [Fimbriimonadaceae bacterium]